MKLLEELFLRLLIVILVLLSIAMVPLVVLALAIIFLWVVLIILIGVVASFTNNPDFFLKVIREEQHIDLN